MTKFNFKSVLAIALVAMMVLSLVPMAVFADEASATKITSVDQLVSGQYVIATTTNKALSVISEKWALAADVAPADGKITGVTGNIAITVTVDGGKITLKDGLGQFIGNGNKNEMAAAETKWAVSEADGNFTLTIDGNEDGRTLCYAVTYEKFRQYTPTTITGTPDNYVTTFNFYKIEGTVPPMEQPEAKPAEVTIPEFAAIANGLAHNTATTEKYIVTGTIKDIANTKYGNMTIEDAKGNTLYIYGLYSADGSIRFDAMDPQPVVGDTVTLVGVASNYNGAQMKNAWMTACVPAPTTLTIPEFAAIANGLAHNAATAEKYIVTGTIQDIANTKYGNMTIADADGNTLYIYGLYSADGSVRFDKMDPQPAVGDTVTLVGVASNYNGAQMKNAWMTALNAGDEPKPDTKPETKPETEVKPEDPKADTELTVEEVIALGASKEHNTYTEGKYYVTGEIVEVYNTQYGNMKIKDAKGNILTIYGTYSADGSTRYDAMEKQPQVGDTVKVYGIVGQYNNVAQVKNGWIVAHKTAGAQTGDAMIVMIPAMLLAGVAVLCVVSRKRRFN